MVTEPWLQIGLFIVGCTVSCIGALGLVLFKRISEDIHDLKHTVSGLANSFAGAAARIDFLEKSQERLENRMAQLKQTT